MISRKEVILNVLSRVVSQICPEDNFEHYFISGGGNPISEKNEENARNVFRIPADVNVYFVTSANMFGGINIGGKGFAITPEGIYYTDDKKNRGLIDIDDFMDADLRIKITFVLTDTNSTRRIKGLFSRCCLICKTN